MAKARSGGCEEGAASQGLAGSLKELNEAGKRILFQGLSKEPALLIP